MMGSFKALNLGLHNRAYYLISMDDSLQTIKETKNAGADMALEYINRGVHYREIKRDNARKQPQMQVS